jgi:hypothetical protein
LKSRVDQLKTADWEMNTDLIAAFRILLYRAKNENISQEDMPTDILILSDMEFDRADT